MTDEPTPSTPARDVRAQRRARRATRIARRERSFNLLASGYTYGQIAKMVRTSAATVRREIDRAFAERRLDATERFAQVQIARLVKALRLAEAAVGWLRDQGAHTIRYLSCADAHDDHRFWQGLGFESDMVCLSLYRDE